MNAKIYEVLLNCASDCIISVFSDIEDTNKFSAGFLVDVTPEFVAIAHIAPTGLYDGYIVKKTDDIYAVKSGGAYEKNLERLYHLRKQSHAPVPCRAGDTRRSILEFAKENKLIVTIELLESGYDDIQGKIIDLEEDTVTIGEVDHSGNDDGISYISMSDISFIACDSDVESSLKLLNDNPAHATSADA